MERSCKIKETSITYEFIHTDPQSPRYGKKGILHAFIAEYNGRENIKLAEELLSYEWITEEDVYKKLNSS